MGIILRPELNNQQKPIFGSGYRLNPSHPLNKGLVAWWMMNEGAGRVIYDLVSNRPASLVGTALGWVRNQNYSKLNAYGLSSNNSSTAGILCDSTPVTGVQVTLVSWFVEAVDGEADTLLGIFSPVDDTNAYYLNLGMASAGDPVRAISYAGSASIATVGTIALNSLNHAAAVFASATSRTAYLNGVGGTANTTNSTPSGLSRIGIACGYGATYPTGPFGGTIYSAEIYNRALSAAEILLSYNSPFGTPDKPRLLFPSTRKYYILTSVPSGDMTGTSTGTSTVTGTLKGAGKLLGTSSGIGAITATLKGFGILIGTSSGLSTCSGTIKGQGLLIGTSSGLAYCTGTLNRPPGDMTGASNGTSLAIGTLKGAGRLAGTSAALASAMATLKGLGLLSGTAAGFATASIIDHALSQISGISNGFATVTGWIWNAQPLPDSANYEKAETLVVKAESRTLTVESENRELVVKPESRTLIA
jgi:hypothetical protein